MKKIIALIVVLFIVSSCESTKQLKSLEAENVELKKRIGDFEISMNDTDKDGVPDYLDVEPNSVSGIMVDTKGRMIFKNHSAFNKSFAFAKLMKPLLNEESIKN